MLFRNLCTLLLIIAIGIIPCDLAAKKDSPDSKNTASPSLLPFKKIQPTITPQNALEKEILQAFDGLWPIAEGLAKFTQSKESQEAIKKKREARLKQEQEAAQRLKQQSRYRDSNRSYSGGDGYGSGGRRYDSYSGYGGGGSYGGGRGGHYAGSSSSGRSSGTGHSGIGREFGSTPSSSRSPSMNVGRNDYGRGLSESDDDDEDEYSDEDERYDNIDKKNKNTKGSTLVVPKDQPKTAENHYTKATNYARLATKLIQGTLDKFTTKGEPAISQQLLTDTTFFDALSKEITGMMNETEVELSPKELAKFEADNNNQLTEEKKKLTAACKLIWPHLLHAATLTPAEGFNTQTHKEAQEAATRLLKLEYLQLCTDERTIEQRVKKILTQDDTLYKKIGASLETFQQQQARNLPQQTDPFTQVMRNIESIAPSLGINLPLAQTPKARKDAILAFLTQRKAKIDALIKQVPVVPALLTNELKDITNKLSHAQLLPEA